MKAGLHHEDWREEEEEFAAGEVIDCLDDQPREAKAN